MSVTISFEFSIQTDNSQHVCQYKALVSNGTLNEFYTSKTSHPNATSARTSAKNIIFRDILNKSEILISALSSGNNFITSSEETFSLPPIAPGIQVQTCQIIQEARSVQIKQLNSIEPIYVTPWERYNHMNLYIDEPISGSIYQADPKISKHYFEIIGVKGKHEERILPLTAEQIIQSKRRGIVVNEDFLESHPQLLDFRPRLTPLFKDDLYVDKQNLLVFKGNDNFHVLGKYEPTTNIIKTLSYEDKILAHFLGLTFDIKLPNLNLVDDSQQHHNQRREPPNLNFVDDSHQHHNQRREPRDLIFVDDFHQHYNQRREPPNLKFLDDSSDSSEDISLIDLPLDDHPIPKAMAKLYPGNSGSLDERVDYDDVAIRRGLDSEEKERLDRDLYEYMRNRPTQNVEY